MSAMPERVWLKEYPQVGWRTASQSEKEAVPYVPESRLLAAEARVREAEAELGTALDQVMLFGSDIDRLRAERDALVARIEKAAADLRAVGGYDNELLAVPAGGVRSILTDLRAILAREVGE